MNSLLHRLIGILPMLALAGICPKCEGGDGPVDFEAMTRQCHSIITNRTSPDAALLEAISRLGRVTETPIFWTQVADDQSYSAMHRKRCIMALFRRHGMECETLADLGGILGQPHWLTNSSVSEVAVITGWIPVDVRPGDTVFAITILSKAAPKERSPPSSPRFAIYMRVSGQMTKEDFVAFLQHGRRNRGGGNAFIEQFGFIDDYEEWLRAPSKRLGAKQRKAGANTDTNP